MLLSGKLFPHLLAVDEAVQGYLDIMVPRMAAATGVTEELKASDQMEWVGRMNAIHAQCERNDTDRLDLLLT